jgi:hypothetical protein
LKTRYKILILISIGVSLIALINYLKAIGQLKDIYLVLIVIIGLLSAGLIGKNR